MLIHKNNGLWPGFSFQYIIIYALPMISGHQNIHIPLLRIDNKVSLGVVLNINIRRIWMSYVLTS